MQVMIHAIEGRLSKHALATVLNLEPRRVFLDACAAIEKKNTDECAAAKDPCLESGCSAEGERCTAAAVEGGHLVSQGLRSRMGQAVFHPREPGEHMESTWRLAVAGARG